MTEAYEIMNDMENETIFCGFLQYRKWKAFNKTTTWHFNETGIYCHGMS